mgnify:CR=1 FL=1
MKISREWLQLYFEAPLPGAGVIADALTFHAFEIDGLEPVREAAAIEDAGKAIDYVLDVKVTPNRGHDALSHRGIAKELAAILNLPLSNDPLQDAPNLIPATDTVSVTVTDSELCPRYIAGHVKGVKVGPSPVWLTAKLEAIGQRSINNIVDATNFVMFNIGQPLHAFDAGKLHKGESSVNTKDSPLYAIEVRRAHKGEIMRALDDKEYTLSESNLVIADKNSGIAIGIAGVKGGKPAGITEATTDIIIESANFNGVSVRKTAKALNLTTDASQRFQQVLSPELAAFGMHSVVELIREIAGGKLVGFTDVYPNPVKAEKVTFTAAHTSELLGITVSPEEISASLTRLGFSFTEEGEGTFTVLPPRERLDLIIPEDCIEEVGRLIGYEKIPAKALPVFEKQPAVNQNFDASERVREDLIAKGYSEVYTSVFADKGERAVLNKVDSVKPFLRSNLTDGLTEALKKNMPNKDLLGLKEVKLFEIGTIWKGGTETMVVGMIGEKEKATEKILAEFGTDVAHDNFSLSETERYRAFSRYPSITRDIALWVPADTASEEIRNTIMKSAGNLMVRIDQFDEFKKGEKTSYAFRLVFQSFEKTLTDDEANAAMNAVYEDVKAKGWEVR